MVAVLPDFFQKDSTCSPRGRVPAFTQRHSKLLCSARKAAPVISRGTAPVAGELAQPFLLAPTAAIPGSMAELNALQEKACPRSL